VFHKIIEISGHSGAIYVAAFDQKYLYTGSADQFVTRWNLSDGSQDKFAIKMNQSVYAIEFISSNRLIIGLSNGSLHVFDIEKKIEIKHFTQHIKAVFSICSNTFKNQFYTGDADGNLSIWNSVTLELLIYLPLDCGKVRNISISTDGNHFVVSCQDGTLRIFETVGFNEVVTIDAHKDGATIAKFHPTNPNQLISGGKDAYLKIWNWQIMELVKSIPAHNYVIYDICFLKDNSQFATASRDKTIKIWNLSTFEVIQRLDLKSGGHKHSVNKLTKISETSFVSVGDDKRIICWDNQ